MSVQIRRQHGINHKRIHRVYCGLGLNLRKKPKKRRIHRHAVPLDVPSKPNVSWAMDFMHDSLLDGQAVRTLYIVDEASREALAIQAGVSLPAPAVVRTLDRLTQRHGKPK